VSASMRGNVGRWWLFSSRRTMSRRRLAAGSGVRFARSRCRSAEPEKSTRSGDASSTAFLGQAQRGVCAGDVAQRIHGPGNGGEGGGQLAAHGNWLTVSGEARRPSSADHDVSRQTRRAGRVHRHSPTPAPEDRHRRVGVYTVHQVEVTSIEAPCSNTSPLRSSPRRAAASRPR
jgi:hypothetical protein